MFSYNTLPVLAGLASLAMASPTTVPPRNSYSTIDWFTCDQNATLPVTCGTLAVPLDYTEPNSTTTIDIQLLKFAATKGPSKGSILVNPGGPGDSAREFLAAYAEEMMIATSEHYDLIAFETRGVGDTLPFSCFSNDSTRVSFESSVPASTNDSDTSLGLTWSFGTVLSDVCYTANKDIGELMSTAFIARDMMQVVDALGEDGLLRYLGFSYGTVLGATVAAMFPDRMDKVVLDGVVNSYEWIAGSNKQEALQSDTAVLEYFKSCLDEPDDCAIHRNNTTASELYDEVVQFLEEIKYNPLVLGDTSIADIVQYATVKTLIFLVIKTGITNARLLSVFLNAVLEKDLTTYLESLEVLVASSPPVYPNYGPEAVYGIQCPDIQLRSDSPEGIEPLVKYMYNESYYAGPSVIDLLIPCAQWKMRSKETFAGPFQGKTRNPILFVSSPYDPATPLASARNMSSGFEGSRILQHNGIGHASIAQPSTCTIRATSAYFLNGTLPPVGTICEPDFGFLSNHTIPEIYELAAT